ncbi:MAG: ABC transporter permease subunit [Vicinamibacterales bacterium]
MSLLSPAVLVLCRTELRSVLRDRRAVSMSIVLPLIITPVMFFASQWAEQRRTQQLTDGAVTFSVAGDRHDALRELVREARGLQPADGAPADPPVRLVERESLPDPLAVLQRGDIDLVVESEPVTAASEEQAAIPPGTPSIRILYRSDRDRSRLAADWLAARLARVRHARQLALLDRTGVVLQPRAAAPAVAVDLSPAARSAGLGLGRVATLLLVFFLFSGGALVAQDTLAGEKERGTLETLLTTAMTRQEIVLAKVLLVVFVALIITAIQVTNLLVFAGLRVGPPTASLSVVVSPALALGLLIFLLPLAAFVAGILVLLSGYSRSHREAQLYFLPVLLVSLLPASAAFLPAASLRSLLLLVPIANVSVAVKDLLVGRIDWPLLAGAWIVNAVAAALTLQAAAKTLTAERLIVPSTERQARVPGMPARPGQLATWFAAMWGLIFLVSNNLGAEFDIRGQLVINLVLIFFGGSLLFIRFFGLSAREVLSLRLPSTSAWLGVAIGAPAGLVTGLGLFRLSQLVVPVPPDLLEAFAQYLAPDSLPTWQILPLMTILPGVCEEVAFRGVLLNGLRPHFSKTVTALLVGLTFGLFHFSVFRIAQTAYLGVLLALVTMWSGSIFPAMLWHAASNGLALAAGRYGVELGHLPPAAYGFAAAVLAASLWLIRRSGRHPAPGRVASFLAVMLAVGLHPSIAGAQPSLAEARTALASGDARRAITAADAILAKSPLATDALTLKLEALASASDWETGLDAYERFLKAGGREDADMLKLIGTASLREVIAFFPTVRQLAQARLACGGDRTALLELRRSPIARPDDVDGMVARALLGDVAVGSTLRDRALDGPPATRVAALQGLAQLRDRGAGDAVRSGLKHPDPNVRLAALRLARTTALGGVEAEIQALLADQVGLVTAEATAALAVLGDERAISLLPGLAASPIPDVRLAALAAQLQRQPTPAVLQGLAAVARLRSSGAWMSAVDLLAESDPGAAASALRDALGDDNPSVRIQALRLASQVPMNEQGDLARFRGLLRDPNTFVRLEASAVLATRSWLCGS